jgi:hypothetical protein
VTFTSQTSGKPLPPELPHWDSPPLDLKAAVREIKPALRARIAASGRGVEEVFSVIEDRARAKVADIVASRERGETVWPVIAYADIDKGTVPAQQLEKLRRRIRVCSIPYLSPRPWGT